MDEVAGPRGAAAGSEAGDASAGSVSPSTLSNATMPPGIVSFFRQAANARPGLVLLAGDDPGAGDAAVELATALAGDGHRIVLCDLSLLGPALHRILDVPNDEGMTDLFEFGASLRRVSAPVPEGGFFFAPAGIGVADPQRIAGHPRWDRLLEGARDAGATLLLYAPASLPGADRIAGRVGAVAVVGAPADADTVAERLPAGCSLVDRVPVAPVPDVASDEGKPDEALAAFRPFDDDAEPRDADAGVAPAATAVTTPSSVPDAEEPPADVPAEPIPESAAVTDAAEPEPESDALERDAPEPDAPEPDLPEADLSVDDRSDLPDTASLAAPVAGDTETAESGGDGAPSDAPADEVLGGPTVPTREPPPAEAIPEPPPAEAAPEPPPEKGADATAVPLLEEGADRIAEPPPEEGADTIVEPLPQADADDARERPASDAGRAAEGETALPPLARTGLWIGLGVIVVLLLLALVFLRPGADAASLEDVAPPPEPAVAESAVPATPAQGEIVPHGYTVAIEAHPDLAAARARLSRLQRIEDGMPFLITPFPLEDGAPVYRVMAGPYADSAEAVVVRDILYGDGRKSSVSEWDVRPTAFGYLMDEAATMEAAHARALEFTDAGIPAYAVPVGPDGAARIYAGAFSLREQASVLAEQLSEMGLDPPLVRISGWTSAQ
jgi:Mrp family chromosome partitioning ATPase